jgi:hypothetical protein
VGTAHVERTPRRTVSARMARVESPLRKGELASGSSSTGGSETATGGMGVEGGTGMAALAGTGLAAGARAGSDGLDATASTGSGSAMSSASTVSSSTTGFSEACVTRAVGAGGPGRTDGRRGGGFDERVARGGGDEGVIGRGGSRDGGRLADGFVAGTLAGGREGGACTAGVVGVSRRPSSKAFATSICRLTVVSASLVLSRPIAAMRRHPSCL